jgi:putative addiction module component (TIGR02574 family)
MTERANILIAEARKLSADERIAIAEAMMASLEGTHSDAELDAAWLAEAKDRLAAYRRGEIEARDFDDVMAKYDRQ